MRLTLPTIVLMSTVLAALPAWSAAVTSVSGTVLINHGDGFKPVKGTVQAKVGDSVTARPGATGQVVYADGCPVPVNPGSVITISAESPCQAYAADLDRDRDRNRAVIVPPPTLSPLLVTAGIIGLVAGVVVFVANQNDNPASP